MPTTGDRSYWRRLARWFGLRTGPAQPSAVGGRANVPDPASFQDGDFVWPKRKGALIVRGNPGGASDDERAFEAGRAGLMAPSRTEAVASPEVAERLISMRYQDFEKLYFGDAAGEPADTRNLAMAGYALSVGHVGIIEIDGQGQAHVIEATPTGRLVVFGSGAVIRTPYAEWLAGRADVQVWHGRMRQLDADARGRIAQEALRQLGKPYDFFNFNLIDDSSFYCSKLPWLSVWRAASVAIDGDPDPRRGDRFPPWFTPKQMLRSTARVAILHNPDEF